MQKINLALETRTCKCGCGKTWRALPTSTNEYFASSHKRVKQELHDWIFGKVRMGVEQQTIHARIKEMYEKGLSVPAITNRINEMGFRNAKLGPFTAASIYAMVYKLKLKRT